MDSSQGERKLEPLSDLALVGPRLREQRRQRGWSLERLAERTGLSVSTLSRLETGRRRASLEILLPVTRALGIQIDGLLSSSAPLDPRVKRPVVRRSGMLIEPLSQESSPAHTFKITYPPRGPMPNPRVHGGREWLYVLSGRLRLHLAGREIVLSHGEAADFDTMTPHAMAAQGGRPAVVLSIFNEEGASIHTRTAQRDVERDHE